MLFQTEGYKKFHIYFFVGCTKFLSTVTGPADPGHSVEEFMDWPMCSSRKSTMLNRLQILHLGYFHVFRELTITCKHLFFPLVINLISFLHYLIIHLYFSILCLFNYCFICFHSGTRSLKLQMLQTAI